MIETVLPEALTAEAFGDSPEAYLLSGEEGAIENAVDKRRSEYTTARHLARQALERLGLPTVAILSGTHREPLWPAGVVGSITHCVGYRAAAVARNSTLLTVGIDAEPNEPLPDGVLQTISLPCERVHLDELSQALPEVCWDRMLFSMKESVYKAWFPLTHRWLGFEQALINVDLMHSLFTARLLVSPPFPARLTGAAHFKGRWTVGRGLVMTAIATPPLAGRRRECHPPSPTDPDVNLSAHPARAAQLSGHVPQRPVCEQVGRSLPDSFQSCPRSVFAGFQPFVLPPCPAHQ
jgi:4'-phosphopantetheinyl transferase EntD